MGLLCDFEHLQLRHKQDVKNVKMKNTSLTFSNCSSDNTDPCVLWTGRFVDYKTSTLFWNQTFE